MLCWNIKILKNFIKVDFYPIFPPKKLSYINNISPQKHQSAGMVNVDPLRPIKYIAVFFPGYYNVIFA